MPLIPQLLADAMVLPSDRECLKQHVVYAFDAWRPKSDEEYRAKAILLQEMRRAAILAGDAVDAPAAGR